MKNLKIIFLIIFLLTLSSTAFALNLDVDNDLNDFAKENLIKEKETKNLKNPFFIEKEVAAISEQENNLEAENKEQRDPKANSSEQKSESREEITAKPEIVINGVITASNSRMALLLSYQQERHLLKIGEKLDGYRLTAYKNGKATFIKNGVKTEVIY